jgi:hypothetical protein
MRSIRAKRRGSVFSKARCVFKAESKSTLLLLYLREKVNEQDNPRADKQWRDTLMDLMQNLDERRADYLRPNGSLGSSGFEKAHGNRLRFPAATDVVRPKL